MPDDRIPTNQSQLDINTSIQAINTQIQALNTLIGSLGLVTITPISQDDYDALTPVEQLAGVFDIYDAVEPDIDGNKVLYSSSPKKTIIEKIDEIDHKSILIGSSTGSKTYAQHLATIKALWDTLTAEQKGRAYIRRNENYIYQPATITQGRFYMMTIDSNTIYMEFIDLSTSKFGYFQNGTFNDLSSSTTTTKHELYVM